MIGILLGQQPAEDASDVKELRAFAAPRLRPADPCGIEFQRQFFKNSLGTTGSFSSLPGAYFIPIASAGRKTVESVLKRVDYC